MLTMVNVGLVVFAIWEYGNYSKAIGKEISRDYLISYLVVLIPAVLIANWLPFKSLFATIAFTLLALALYAWQTNQHLLYAAMAMAAPFVISYGAFMYRRVIYQKMKLDYLAACIPLAALIYLIVKKYPDAVKEAKSEEKPKRQAVTKAESGDMTEQEQNALQFAHYAMHVCEVLGKFERGKYYEYEDEHLQIWGDGKSLKVRDENNKPVFIYRFGQKHQPELQELGDWYDYFRSTLWGKVIKTHNAQDAEIRKKRIQATASGDPERRAASTAAPPERSSQEPKQLYMSATIICDDLGDRIGDIASYRDEHLSITVDPIRAVIYYDDEKVFSYRPDNVGYEVEEYIDGPWKEYFLTVLDRT